MNKVLAESKTRLIRFIRFSFFWQIVTLTETNVQQLVHYEKNCQSKPTQQKNMKNPAGDV